MNVIEVSAMYGGRLLKLQTGKIAKQADAAVMAQYGDTIVLVTVVSSTKLGQDPTFFPLTVDYQEKYYAAGRIPGGFFKREARPSDKATLSARLIDRPIRPLFPEDYLYDTFVTVTVLSTDGVNEPDFLASIAASAALHISDIPWSGPIACCRVGKVDGQFVANISPEQGLTSSVDLLLSGMRSGIVMVEGSAKEVSEKDLMDAIDFGHREMQVVWDLQDDLRLKVGKTKRQYDRPARDEALKTEMRTFLWKPLEKAFAVREKLPRYQALAEVAKKATEKFGVKTPASDADKVRNKLVAFYVDELKATFARELTVNSKHRIDGRGYSEIRDITSEVGLLPRVHGSGLFTRGETQVLSTVTLGTSDDEQKIDSISGTYQKTFLLHYNFPPFSVGEARPLRPPGRREVGHGFLAERALSSMIPAKDVFPYTIRLVSEVLESNGSSSMATVCSGSLALMDAGVPIPKPVAGVAMGLIKEGAKVAVLSDILGDEDHLGDMDFKVCGTADGITAFQMDLKIGGIDRVVMEQALEQAREGRLHVLEKMNATLQQPRGTFSQYAPRIFTIKVKPSKVREVIGSGGKVIRSIIERTGCKIDIEDDGTINVASNDQDSANKAIEIIQNIVAEPEIGRIYQGKVSRIADFGAFVEIIPGTDGLCHISELDHSRVRHVEDVCRVGDIIPVKCLDVDGMGKIRLSRKAALVELDKNKPEGTSGDEGSSDEDAEESDAPRVQVKTPAASAKPKAKPAKRVEAAAVQDDKDDEDDSGEPYADDSDEESFEPDEEEQPEVENFQEEEDDSQEVMLARRPLGEVRRENSSGHARGGSSRGGQRSSGPSRGGRPSSGGRSSGMSSGARPSSSRSSQGHSSSRDSGGRSSSSSQGQGPRGNYPRSSSAAGGRNDNRQGSGRYPQAKSGSDYRGDRDANRGSSSAPRQGGRDRQFGGGSNSQGSSGGQGRDYNRGDDFGNQRGGNADRDDRYGSRRPAAETRDHRSYHQDDGDRVPRWDREMERPARRPRRDED